MSSSWKVAIVTQLVVSGVLGTLIAIVVSFYTSIEKFVFAREPSTKENRRKMRNYFFKWAAYDILLVAAVFALADGAVLAMPYVWGGYRQLLNWLGVQVAQTGIAAAVVAIGYGAFRFKEAHKKLYGFMEVAFSGVSVVVALMTTKPDARVGLVITVIGAMYVSSRGFGNWLGKEQNNSSSASISSSSLPARK
jgi:hypothetical protein